MQHKLFIRLIALLLVPALAAGAMEPVGAGLVPARNCGRTQGPPLQQFPGSFRSQALATRFLCAWNAQGPASWEFRQRAQGILASAALSVLIGWGLSHPKPQQNTLTASAGSMAVADILMNVRKYRMKRVTAIQALCALAPKSAGAPELEEESLLGPKICVT